MDRRDEISSEATFADLGIPFPLFEAPVIDASDYAGPAVCRLCRESDRHCFEVDDLIAACPACGAENGLSTRARADVACRACGSTVPFPEALRAKKQMLVCYRCLRAGKAAITKDTEFGAVGADEAFTGMTDAHPAPPTDQFELIAVDIEDDEPWYRARIPGEHLWELLRTPTMSTWQGERWLFCCQRPMSYLGGYEAVPERVRPDDSVAFVESLFGPEDEVAGWIGEAVDAGNVSLYLYQCKACDRHRTTFDHT